MSAAICSGVKGYSMKGLPRQFSKGSGPLAGPIWGTTAGPGVGAAAPGAGATAGPAPGFAAAVGALTAGWVPALAAPAAGPALPAAPLAAAPPAAAFWPLATPSITHRPNTASSTVTRTTAAAARRLCPTWRTKPFTTLGFQTPVTPSHRYESLTPSSLVCRPPLRLPPPQALPPHEQPVPRPPHDRPRALPPLHLRAPWGQQPG